MVNAISIAEDLVKMGSDFGGAVCPPRQFSREHICDISVLAYSFNIRVDNQLVECTLRYQIERCTEDYVLSDLVHSITLFPGEEVFLSTRSRHSLTRFTEDTSVSANSVSRSSDRVWMEAFKSMATNYSETDASVSKASSHSEYSQSNVSGGGGFNFFGLFGASGGASKTSGEFDASSSASFFQQINQHLTSSVHQTNQVTRDTMSVNMTQVNSHRESTLESKEELQVSTRRFRNDNECHTVTHFFWQIGKRQRVKVTFLGRTCRPLNTFANTAVTMKPFQMSVANNAKLNFDAKATDPAPGVAQAGDANLRFNAFQNLTSDQISLQRAASVPFATFAAEEKARQAALAKVDAMLKDQPNQFTHESVNIIPTEALYVESELGNCAICEPELVAKHVYELERMRLENELLEKQITLLEKHKDYRCCGNEEDEG